MQSFHFWKLYKEIILVVDLMICKGLKRGHLFRGCIKGFHLDELQIKAQQWIKLKQEELGVDKDDIFGGSVRWGYLENISEIQFSELTYGGENIQEMLERSTRQVAPNDPWLATLEADIAAERKAIHRPSSEGAD